MKFPYIFICHIQKFAFNHPSVYLDIADMINKNRDYRLVGNLVDSFQVRRMMNHLLNDMGVHTHTSAYSLFFNGTSFYLKRDTCPDIGVLNGE